MKIDVKKRTGKSLIFTDLHVGISNDKPSRQKIAENFINEIVERIDIEGIRQVFFLGDLFHHRTSIEVTSLNVANDLIRELSRHCEVFLLQGNHDLYEKCNSVITSLNIFDLDNVNLVSTPTELELNGQKVLLVPWLCGGSISEHIDRDGMSDKYDIMMGHFDISCSSEIMWKGKAYSDAYKSSSGSLNTIDTTNIVSEILHHTNRFSTVYMGHIHEHEVVVYEDRTWNIVGSPQYQVHDMKRLPEEKKQHGYYILDEGNSEEFHLSASVPKFVTLYASDVLNGNVDKSLLEGAIVRRCYDKILTEEQKAEMDEMISSAKPYEEDSSVFILGISDESDGSLDEEIAESSMSLVADKFDYIKNQIDKIHHDAIDNQRLENMMKEYYNSVTM